ncbi:extracellular calcium-sensing receptor-like [Alosa pseudoharengus]|uniref:extracellular calcium-sensing receptor-like n=1 Tax=Alosa pseudoharengus TaxID=34774 RepID=UPI003F8A7CF6
MHQDGDVIIGGLFEIYLFSVFPELTFSTKPAQPWCHEFYLHGFKWAQTMAFAINEVNRNPHLLPNISLGYSIYDNCINLGVAFRAATTLISGAQKTLSSSSCRRLPSVLGIVGDSVSTHSIAISSVMGLFHIPMVSYFATCSCLSDRQRYPSFFRTIPSDAFQVRAMIQILQHFRWTWVGLIYSDDDYGRHAAQSFHQDVTAFGGCIAFSEVLPKDNDMVEIRKIMQVIKTSTSRVIVAFSTEPYLLPLMDEVARQNVIRQWIASEAWSFSPLLLTSRMLPFLRGTLGIVIRRGEIEGLKEFLLSVRPNNDHKNSMVRKFWQEMFNCRFEPEEALALSEGRVCTGEEDLSKADLAYSDVSDLRVSYNVYKAVYSLAHSLHNLMSCVPGQGPFKGNSCASPHDIQPWQLLHYLQAVNFTTGFGDQVSFDKTGEALAIYDIFNWYGMPDGTMKTRTVGIVDESQPTGKTFHLDEGKLTWNFELNKPPRSVCSEPCHPGTRKARRKGLPVCCFDCLPCADGEISNISDAIECFKCPVEFWSNFEKDICIPKEVEYLSYEEALGISLTSVSLFGACASTVVLAIFVHHRHTPVVRANNSELSFLILLSLKLCFLCALLFIGQPRQWTCQLRHAAFGISFVLCVSSILVKTMVVIAVFKASRPEGKGAMKWFGAAQQRATVIVLTSLQVAICVIWLSTASPTPHKNTHYQSSKIVFECAVGSVAGFATLLGYIGLLAAISFLLAFLARNLPDNFNEAKFITFSMLIFCAVWIAFVPAYISSPGKYADVVEIFAILASSFGLLIAIFAPKCYIILLHPEKNTKKGLMRRGSPK